MGTKLRWRWGGAFLGALVVLTPATGQARLNVSGVSAAGLPSRTTQVRVNGPIDVVAKDPSGIALVGDAPIQVQGLNDQQAVAFDAALNFAMLHRDDLGYPWVEPDTGTLDLAAADAQGSTLLATAQAMPPISAVPTRITTAQASMATLDRISDDVTRLNSRGVTDAGLIYMTEPDQRDNLVIVTISQLSEPLMQVLASQFGTSLIAVRVKAPAGEASASSRSSDSPPFWAGRQSTHHRGLVRLALLGPSVRLVAC